MVGIKQPDQFGVGKIDLLWLDGDSIADIKYFRSLNIQGLRQWNNFAPGSVVWTYRQQFILILKDSAGQNQEITLGKTFTVTCKKVSDDVMSWTIED